MYVIYSSSLFLDVIISHWRAVFQQPFYQDYVIADNQNEDDHVKDGREGEISGLYNSNQPQSMSYPVQEKQK
jgi:hypothetical protein